MCSCNKDKAEQLKKRIIEDIARVRRWREQYEESSSQATKSFVNGVLAATGSFFDLVLQVFPPEGGHSEQVRTNTKVLSPGE